MAPAVDALAARCRVVTFSLADEPTSGFETARGFGDLVAQVESALDRAGIERALIAGVSYGGLIAAEFATRRPARAAGLALVSALPLDWRPDARVRRLRTWPRLLSPVFCLSAPARLYPEIRAALPSPRARLRFLVAHGYRVLRAPMSPARMGRRVRWVEAYRFVDPADITLPALVVTGEPALDRVVSTELTRRYAALPAARHEILPRTGHIGLVTRPREFAALIGDFATEVTRS